MSDKSSEFRFDIKLQDNYILAESYGTESPENMSHVYKEIIDKVIEWDCNRVLYVEGFTNQISLQEMFIVWQNIFRIVEEKMIKGKIAVFDRNRDDHTINMISESLAAARGINARVFNNLDDAVAWLTK